MSLNRSTEEKQISTISLSSSCTTATCTTSFITTTMVSSTEEYSRFSKNTYSSDALGEAMPVYLADVSSIILGKLDGDVITHWQGDKEIKKFSSEQRQQFKLFGTKTKELVDKVGSEEAALLANLILCGEEKDVEEALVIVKKKPDLLTAQCIATDPLKRRVLGTPLQIAAMAGDVNLRKGEIKEEENRGLVERLKDAACLSDEEVTYQLKEVLTSNEAVAENEKRNQRILNAIRAFGEGIIKAKEKYEGNDFVGLQALCHAFIEQLENDLTLNLNEVIKLGYIFDLTILQKAAEWFRHNIKRFEGWSSIQSDVFWVNGFGKLQSKLSSRDAQIINVGICGLVDTKKIPMRSLRNENGSHYFYNSSSRLGLDFFLGYYGAPFGGRQDWVRGGCCPPLIEKIMSKKNSSVAKLTQHSDNAKQSLCVIM